MKQLLILVIMLIIGCGSISATTSSVSSKPQTEKVTPQSDKNPIVGEVTVGGKTYKVRQGAKGGLYYWKQKT